MKPRTPGGTCTATLVRPVYTRKTFDYDTHKCCHMFPKLFRHHLQLLPIPHNDKFVNNLVTVSHDGNF